MATLDNKIWDEQPDEPLPPIELEESQRWSKEIGELVGALAAAQLEFETVTRDTKNPYYSSKYADLSAIVAGTQKALAKQGLVLIQRPEVLVGKQMVVLTSTLAHKSGQWIENKLTLPAIMLGKDGKARFDAQSCGSAMTYARRYSYQSLVGVAAEPDDDGNKGVGIGSSEAAQAVATRKIAELRAKKEIPIAPSTLFFTYPDRHQGNYAEFVNIKEYASGLDTVAAEGLRKVFAPHLSKNLSKTGVTLIPKEHMKELLETLVGDCGIDVSELKPGPEEK